MGPPHGYTHNFSNVDYPPYLIAGSDWEQEWRNSHPGGWKALSDAVGLVQKGDLRTLQYIAKVNPDALHLDDGTPAEWKAVHEAVRSNYMDILKFLIEDFGVSVNEPCRVTGAETPLAIAYQNHGKDHPIAKYLESKGGIILKRPEPVWHPPTQGNSESSETEEL